MSHVIAKSYWCDKLAECKPGDAQWFGVMEEFVKQVVSLADEAAKAQPAEPRADSDVPEWFHKAACGGSMSSHKVRALWEKVEAELTRRVAEATAERDRRIAELEAEHRDLLESIESAYTKLGLHEGNVPPKEKISDTLHQAIDALKQQLATATAEVERLKRDAEQGQAVAEVANMHGWNGCEHSKVLSVHIAEELTELAKLREENARLTRPVEVVRHGPADEFNPALWVAPHIDFLCERNAREAAEAERDELREVVKVRFLHRGEHLINEERVVKISDAELDAVLAADRAEKGKVGT